MKNSITKRCLESYLSFIAFMKLECAISPAATLFLYALDCSMLKYVLEGQIQTANPNLTTQIEAAKETVRMTHEVC